MPNVRRHLFSLPLLLALPLFAQEPAPKTTAAAGPVLVLTTSDAGIAHVVAEGLGYVDDLPAAPADGHYIVSLGGDRACQVGTAAGKVDLFEVIAEPGPLMDAFAEQIEASVPMVRGAFTVGMQQAGMSAKDAMALVQDVLDFPRQLQKLTIKVVGDPTAIPESGLDVTLDLDGKAGTGFASLMAKLAPGDQGAPQLPGDGSLMQFRLSLTPLALQALVRPFTAFSAGITSRTEEQRQRATAMMERWIELYDGGCCVAFDATMRAHMLIGVLDSDKVRALTSSEDYLEAARAQQLPNRDLDIEVAVDALEHRGVKFLQTKVTGSEPNPIMPDGELVTRIGAGGNYVMMTMGGDEAFAKSIVDAVLDRKVSRAPLPDAALAWSSIDLRGLARLLLPGVGMGGEPGEDMPSRLTVRLGKRGTGLQLKLHMQ